MDGALDYNCSILVDSSLFKFARVARQTVLSANGVPMVRQWCANGVQPTASSDTPDSPVSQWCTNCVPTVRQQCAANG
jgi:hypothetical protein